MRVAYSGSFFRLLFRFLANHSGRGRAVEEPEMVYTGTAEWLLIFMAIQFHLRVLFVLYLIVAVGRDVEHAGKGFQNLQSRHISWHGSGCTRRQYSGYMYLIVLIIPGSEPKVCDLALWQLAFISG